MAHEWLVSFIENDSHFINLATKNTTRFKLFAHCTEKTALVNSESDWLAIFNYFGLTLDKVSVGCCGMAGTYGHEKSNLDNSKGLFELSWQTKLTALAPEQILATGFSCRSQVKRFSAAQARHPVEALYAALTSE
jgi:Fe-S oxidoreductase